MSLPPDPTKFNARRAAWAAAAIEAHEKRRGVSATPQEQLTALLCNLSHWADRNKIDMAEALEDADGNYALETRE